MEPTKQLEKGELFTAIQYRLKGSWSPGFHMLIWRGMEVNAKMLTKGIRIWSWPSCLISKIFLTF